MEDNRFEEKEEAAEVEDNSEAKMVRHCGCGVSHGDPDKDDWVYWHMCDGCQTRYAVNENCVGFGVDTAGDDEWICSECMFT